MHDRIHECIDGERGRDELSPHERAQLDDLEAAIGSVSDPLRAGAVPDLSARIMARVVEIRTRPSRVDRAAAAARVGLDWLFIPRSLQIRPAYGIAILTLSFLGVLTLPAPRDGQHTAAVEQPVPRVYVQFRLEAPGASRVALAGNFTGWQPAYELHQTRAGVWSILVPLQPGLHDYSFVVDGEEWVADPHALQIDDGFGGVNSRIALPDARDT